MIGCVEAQRSFILSVLGLTPDQKRGRPEGRPKSREETPKEGCNIGTQRSMLRCMICCIAQCGKGRAVGHGPKLPGACRITAQLIVKL
jgi:hypothetical protein